VGPEMERGDAERSSRGEGGKSSSKIFCVMGLRSGSLTPYSGVGGGRGDCRDRLGCGDVTADEKRLSSVDGERNLCLSFENADVEADTSDEWTAVVASDTPVPGGDSSLSDERSLFLSFLKADVGVFSLISECPLLNLTEAVLRSSGSDGRSLFRTGVDLETPVLSTAMLCFGMAGTSSFPSRRKFSDDLNLFLILESLEPILSG
jgi:hypothetical protein